MSIRSYSQSDCRACFEILESNTPEFFIATDCEGYAAFLNNLPGPYFVLEEIGQIAACGGWAMDPHGVADLTWGMVRRDLHRRGLGRELLHFRLNAIHNHSPATLVRVRTAQVVQGFFIREGFTVIDVVFNGFGTGLDKVTMVLPQPISGGVNPTKSGFIPIPSIQESNNPPLHHSIFQISAAPVSINPAPAGR